MSFTRTFRPFFHGYGAIDAGAFYRRKGRETDDVAADDDVGFGHDLKALAAIAKVGRSRPRKKHGVVAKVDFDGVGLIFRAPDFAGADGVCDKDVVCDIYLAVSA